MIWRTPNGRAFVESVDGDLARGGNAVLELPKPLVQVRFLEELKLILRQKGRGFLSVFDLSGRSARASGELWAILRDGVAWDTVAAPPNFCSPPALSTLFRAIAANDRLSFLALAGLDSLEPQALGSLARGVSEWARLARQPSEFQRPSGLRLVLLAPPAFPETRTDLFLSKRVFWGVIRQSDMDWALARLLEETSAQVAPASVAEGQAEHLFLKALCLGLCHEDFWLMERFVRALPRSLGEVSKILEEHPLQRVARGRELPRAAVAPLHHPSLSGGRPRPRPSGKEEKELWAEGLLTAGGQSGAHPTLLDETELERAVAAAQREVLLPVADHVHELLKATVEMAHGPGIWEHLVKDDERRADILSEISPFAFFLKNEIKPKGSFAVHLKAAAVDCAFSWRAIRHANSHNRLASFALILQAVEDLREFGARRERAWRQERTPMGRRGGAGPRN